MRGLFVTFEGPDGAGKTTQAEILSNALEHLHPVVVREPGGTEVGEKVRSLLLDSSSELAPQAEMYLFLAARAELVADVITPALERDRVVIADRYHDSTLAYQGGARGLETNWPATFPRPDVTFLLDIDPALGLERGLAREADRLESEDLGFHRNVAAEYHRLAMSEPDRFVVLDASRPPEAVHRDVVERVHALLHERALLAEPRATGAATSS